MKTGKALRTSAQLVLVGMLFAATPCAAAPRQYVWPVEESKNLTAGFCDYRAVHYHGGIDISTGGVEGLKVRAADSGYVFRLSTSYWGMGKSLYVKLADGRIAVYGHLSQFAEPIRRYVEAQQYSLRRYNTNLFPLPDELPVERGEVVGYTGQTGYGSPHLHFEIRTGDNFPLNPLANDVGYTDRTSPAFQGVLIRPLLTVDPQSTADGVPEPLYLKVEKPAVSSRYLINKQIMVSGAVGLAVRCGDPTGYKAYDIAPHRLVVRVNGTPWFAVIHDSLDYDLTRQVDLAYDFTWHTTHGADLLALYRHPANQLPWYDPKLGNGVLEASGAPVKSGDNRIEISAFDAAGNEAILELTLAFNQPPRAQDVRFVESGGQWHLTGRAGDSDDYVARLALYRTTHGAAPPAVAWEKKDSITGEQFDYLIPGTFSSNDKLTLILTDSRGAEFTLALAGPDGPGSALQGTQRIDLPIRGEFVSGGLLLRPLIAGKKPAPDEVSLRIQCWDSLPKTWTYYLGATHLLGKLPGNEATVLSLDPNQPKVEPDSIARRAIHGGVILPWDGELSTAAPDEDQTVFSPDSLAAAHFKSGDLYDAGFFRIHVYTIPRELRPKPASKIYSFEPMSVPFARKVKVGITYADSPGRVDDLALYAVSEDRKSWIYLGRDVDADARSMTAGVWSFGAYALVADTQPPAIGKVVPGKEAKITDRRPECTFTLSDDLSGIGSDTDIEILLDGEWLIPEYDPETREVKTRPRADLSLGKHKLEITARDRVGHQDYFVRYFTVVKKSG